MAHNRRKFGNEQSTGFNGCNIVSGCDGMISEETAVPFPYARLIVGTRHCHFLISGNINSDATGIDIRR
jgi:hypothetical protein